MLVNRTLLNDIAATFPNVFNVQGFGAVPNYTTIKTDNTAAFQAAIDLAAAAGGGQVYVPRGQYSIGGTLVLKNYVDLVGEARRSRLNALATLDGPMIALASTTIDKVSVRNLTLTGRKTIATSPNAIGIKFDNAVASGFGLGDPYHLIENVTVEQFKSHGIHMTGNARESRIINSFVKACDGDGVLVENTDCCFMGSTSATNGGVGWNIYGANNRVIGCKAYGNIGYGFEIRGAGRHILNGCEAQDNAGGGYALRSVNSPSIMSSCLADGNPGYGFYFDGVAGSGLSACSGIDREGTRQTHGFFFANAATGNVLSACIANRNVTAAAGGATAGNFVNVNGIAY